MYEISRKKSEVGQIWNRVGQADYLSGQPSDVKYLFDFGL